jgi:hypothetical protein
MSTTKFIQLEEDLQDYSSTMEKAQQAILDQEVSKYPIFVVHQHEIELGVLLVDGTNLGLQWSINASTLEEFLSKQIIQPERVDSFKQVYKDTDQYFCCFVLSELGANFIFLPKQAK